MKRWTREELELLYEQTKYKSTPQIAKEMGYKKGRAISLVLRRHGFPPLYGRRQALLNLTEPQKAYVAGILDGEGYISIKPLAITIANTHYGIISYLKSLMGGFIGTRKQRELRHKQIYIWRSYAVLTRGLLSQILPYLIIKREKALEVLGQYNTYNGYKGIETTGKVRIG